MIRSRKSENTHLQLHMKHSSTKKHVAFLLKNNKQQLQRQRNTKQQNTTTIVPSSVKHSTHPPTKLLYPSLVKVKALVLAVRGRVFCLLAVGANLSSSSAES